MLRTEEDIAGPDHDRFGSNRSSSSADVSRLLATNRRWRPAYFHTDLSAFQRCPFNSLVSASIAPPSSSGSAPSSSAEPESSARLSLAPAPSSAVVVTGLDTHSISLSE